MYSPVYAGKGNFGALIVALPSRRQLISGIHASLATGGQSYWVLFRLP